LDLEGPGCRPFQFRGAVAFRVDLSRPIVIVLALALASRGAGPASTQELGVALEWARRKPY